MFIYYYSVISGYKVYMIYLASPSWLEVNRFCSLSLWLWKGIFLGNRDLWFEFNRHFFPNDSFSRRTSSVSRLDTSSADSYPQNSRPSITLRKDFCTRSSAQVWLTVSVECQTTEAYSNGQRINDI